VKAEGGLPNVEIRFVQTRETNYRLKKARVDKNTGKILKILD
jgi:hypothetical protein